MDVPPAPPAKRRRRFAEPPGEQTRDRGEWLAVARDALIAHGVDAVKIDRLARALGVTRGGFYWRFQDRRELLDALIEDWRTGNGRAMTAPLLASGPPRERFRAFVAVLIEETGFSPAYDLAVRAWSRTDPLAREAVRAVDADRMAALAGLFRDAGYGGQEAEIRARITYYHQIGFYALDEGLSKAERYATSGLYMQVLTGLSDDA
jgi:AcrR family transcriptional regulator